MKKILSLLMVFFLLVSFTGCTKTPEPQETGPKFGIILVGDENEGYTLAHMDGIKAAMKELGISDSQVIWKYNIGETQDCYDAAVDLAENGCVAIFSNSYGHQSYVEQAAREYPEISFVACTGNNAAVSGLGNLSNAFPRTFESRYVSGVVAGMKLAELEAEGKIPAESYRDGKVLIGYVGAFPYEEVKSGFTSFFLGVRSVFENVTMEVVYTNSWADLTAEAEAANTLIADHCVIIGQHADTTGAPSAVEAALNGGTVAYSVGYNVDMLAVAPTAALTSSSNNWSKFYIYAMNQVLKGEKIATEWSEGYGNDAVNITPLGTSCAAGTAEKVEEVIAAIKSGDLQVFDTDSFTVNGQKVTEYNVDFNGETKNVIVDGAFLESEYRSAPYFGLDIDGIFAK
ncbi:MAG: BMP family ABC transporter substrate-binding protein [Erysipelotrichaceae bacterium]|nr:BMP family ABC transporter substrate-binding protein [Erysipelotrichaceae bacterium]